MLRTTEAVHPRLPTATDIRAQGADRPHPSVSRARAAADRPQARRRWDLRWRGGHHRAPRTEAHPARQPLAAQELLRKLTGGNGRAMAPLTVERPMPATVRRNGADSGSAHSRWTVKGETGRNWGTEELRPCTSANGGHGGQRRRKHPIGPHLGAYDGESGRNSNNKGAKQWARRIGQ
jgi:hypothetical protein